VTEHEARSCPDATVLAAFAESRLAPGRRAEVERHLANCPECPAVVGEVTRFLAAEVPGDAGTTPPHHRWWYIAAAVAAICVSLALWHSASDPLRQLRKIAAASPERTYEGRLHGFAHARFRSPRGGAPRPVPMAVKAEAERLAQRDATADVLHARGIAALLGNKPDEAARLLNAAARSAPDDATIWNDLAAVELVRASLGHRAATTSALHAAGRAAQLSPSSPDAHYNRALALEQLGRHSEAATELRQTLAHETSDAWRAEVRERLQRLDAR
jgi:tetratricopeptide (TPR) repeat protein